MSDLDRVVVIGTSCSGKTTFAASLAERLKCVHIELDRMHWRPDWEASPDTEFRALARAATEQERWVVDGNYGVVRDITWQRATAIIWLDNSFPVVFGRALWRSLRRSIAREELYAGNRETLRKTFFSRDSILLWVLTTYHRRRREYPALLNADEHAHLTVHRLRTPSEASRFLIKVSESSWLEEIQRAVEHG